MDALCPQDGSLDVIPRECKGSIGFTLAFENYILILIPAAILALLAPIRLRTIWSKSVKVVNPTILHTVKSFSSLCFVGFSLGTLIVSTQLAEQWRRSETTAAAFFFLASVFCLVLSHLEHFRSIRPSVLLQLYLLIAVIVEAVHLRTIWIRSSNVKLKTVCCGQLASCAVFLASESVQKESILVTRTRRSPQDINDLFSQRLFWWLNRLFKEGYRKILAPRDLFSIDEELASQETQRRFRLNWLSITIKRPKTSPYWILFLSMKRYFLFPIIPRLLLLGVTFAQPYLIQRFVAFVDNTETARPNEGPLLVLAAFCVYVSLATFQSWYWQCQNRFETKIRGILITAIHEKALRTRPSTEFSPLMLMNVDVEKAVTGLRWQHEFWSVTISMAIALALLKAQVGLSFIAPTVLMAILMVVISQNGSQVPPRQKIWLAATQKRVSFVTQSIAAMKNIKLMGLVRMIQGMGIKLREEEVEAQKGIRKAIFFNLCIAQFTFQLCSVVMYGGYAIQTRLGGAPLTNSNLFTSMAILKLFTTPLISTIQYLPMFLQGLAALSRIQTYLLSGEHHDGRKQSPESDRQIKIMAPTDSDDNLTLVRLESLQTGYITRSSVLTNVTMAFKDGKSYMLLGVVGSGKSTLLKAIIGETLIESGDIQMSTFDTSLCDQQPWLWNGTIRDNIVGEEEYNDGWFDQVTWSCGLQDDFAQFPKGVETKAGDDGTSLSGGQKNRISLARAVYSRKRLFIADDILSGLDTNTEGLVFRRVFGPNGLLKKTGSTVILATHSVGWRRYFDEVLIIDSGTIAYQGGPATIPSRFSRLISHETSIRDEDQPASSEGKEASACVEEADEDAQSVPRDKRIYIDYLRSFGGGGLVFYFTMTVLPHVFKSMEQIWLKWWAGANTTDNTDLAKFSSVYAVFIISHIVSMTGELWFALLHMLPRSSIYLHAMQWKALVEVAFSSWGSQNNGSVSNRFSQDLALVDLQLPSAFMNLSSIVFEIIANIILILVATPFVAAALPVVAGVLYVIQNIYLRTSKQLRVMDLEAKAPLCAHFLETAAGVVTIKAFGWADKNREKSLSLLEKSQAPFYLLLSIQQWLQLVLDLLVAGLAVVLMSVVVATADSLDAGYLGIALLQIMDLGQFLGLLVTMWTMFDTSLGAVARIKDFCRNMPQEQQGQISPPKDWLAEGRIDIQHLTASYSPTAEAILQDVNLTIAPGTKLAICGRTGSGKSSLASALFGLLHVQSGAILVDGVDITQVSQDELRAKMVVLPQDAYFCPGTVRDNLAMRQLERSVVTDEDMLGALEKVGLSEKFAALAVAEADKWPGPLDVELNPSEMLTRGQQQLFAMARTMLSRGSVLVIDEATSGLDAESDRLVQKLLRSEMRGRTIVAIAHRLGTIMDFDTMVVMDKGEIAEVGCPRELVGGGGRFDALVKNGGVE